MTSNQDKIIRTAFFFAGIPFLYFVITNREPNWIYYISLFLLFAGIIYGMRMDWKLGKKKEVKGRLIIYGAIIAVMLLMGIFNLM